MYHIAIVFKLLETVQECKCACLFVPSSQESQLYSDLLKWWENKHSLEGSEISLNDNSKGRLYPFSECGYSLANFQVTRNTTKHNSFCSKMSDVQYWYKTKMSHWKSL